MFLKTEHDIPGNLLRHDHCKLEKQRSQQLRILKWEYIELRDGMKEYNEHLREKIKRRRDLVAQRREQRRLEAEMMKRAEEGLEEPPSPPSRQPKEKPVVEPRPQSAVPGVRIGEELMIELGLSGVEVPKLEGSWGKVSRTALNLHRQWDRERNERVNSRKKPPRTAVSDPGGLARRGEEPLEEPRAARQSTRSHQSYFQTCLARPFSYEEFADRKISCRENEVMWMETLRVPNPRVFKRFAVSGEENSIAQRQFSERNLEKAKQDRSEVRANDYSADGGNVSDKITRMKFTSTKLLEERAEMNRKIEEGKLQTDKLIRRHKYQDKNISVEDISRETPSYLRYRYTGEQPSEYDLRNLCFKR